MDQFDRSAFWRADDEALQREARRRRPGPRESLGDLDGPSHRFAVAIAASCLIVVVPLGLMLTLAANDRAVQRQDTDQRPTVQQPAKPGSMTLVRPPAWIPWVPKPTVPLS